MASTGAPEASDWDWGALDCEVWTGFVFGCCLDLSLKRKIWLMMISAKVTANTINMRRSPPGSCCGFLYSAKFKFRSRDENFPANYPGPEALFSRSLAAPDPIPRARRDGSATAARRPAGLRKQHRGTRPPQSHIASKWERSGRNAAAWAR